MKYTINVHTLHNIGGIISDGGYADEFNSVEDAAEFIRRQQDLGYNESYTYEIVKVCDDPESSDYCKIIEVLDTFVEKI